MPKGRHGELVNAVKDYLTSLGWVGIKTQTARVVMTGKGGKVRAIRTGTPGWPDLTGCMLMTDGIHAGPLIGRMVCAEIKIGKDTLSEAQLDMHARLVKAGALVLTVRDSLDGLRKVLP